MTTINMTMTFSKETKNTVVYKNENKDAAVQALYVMKSALGDIKPPKTIKLVVGEKK